MTPDRRAALQARLIGRARAFDIAPLVDILEWLGYAWTDIRFESNAEPTPSRSVVEALRFESDGVVVTLNLGLTGHRGLLPGYFEAVAESLPEPARLYRFLQFFEHPLLSDWVAAHTLERQAWWRKMRDGYFSMLGLGSVSTLSWLFGLMFPELGVHVHRAAIRTQTDAHTVVLGKSQLDGSGVLGVTYDAGSGGFEVSLRTDDEHDGAGRAWWQVASRRVAENVLPLLDGRQYTLVVYLVVNEHESWAQLQDTSQLGYDRVTGDPREHRIVVYQG